MKKTLLILSLVAAAGMASAADLTYKPFEQTTEADWKLQCKKKTQFTLDNSTGTMSSSQEAWPGLEATLDLSQVNGFAPISLAQDQVLTFSYTMYRPNPSAVFSLSLLGESRAIVTGALGYGQDTTDYGLTAQLPTGDTGFIYSADKLKGSGERVILSETPVSTNRFDFSGTIYWAGDQFMMNISDGTATATGIALGSSVDVQKIYLSYDGDGNKGVHTISAFEISVKSIPEPTTATLSLLALAGLAARRRRK